MNETIGAPEVALAVWWRWRCRRWWRASPSAGRTAPWGCGERLYHDLVANSFGLICTHDPNGVLLMINPAAAQGLGYSPAELEGRSLREILAPSTRGAFDKYLERVRAGRPLAGLMRVVTRDGAERVWMYRNHFVARRRG